MFNKYFYVFLYDRFTVFGGTLTSFLELGQPDMLFERSKNIVYKYLQLWKGYIKKGFSIGTTHVVQFLIRMRLSVDKVGVIIILPDDF